MNIPINLVVKLFGCVDIDIERKNISISADIEGAILSTKQTESGTPKAFFVYYNKTC